MSYQQQLNNEEKLHLTNDHPLILALESGNKEEFQAFIDTMPNVDAEISIEGGEVAKGGTLVCIFLKSPDFLHIVLEAGANPNITWDEFGAGSTPLHEAAFHGHTESVEMLIQYGAKVNVQDQEGKTPLLMAASSFNYNDKLVLFLLKHKVDVTLANNDCDLPIHMAAYYGSLKSWKASYL